MNDIRKALIIKNISREGSGLIQTVLESERIGFEIVDLSNGGRLPRLSDFSSLIVMGGPPSANDKTKHMMQLLDLIRESLRAKLPYLGVCLGMQTLVKAAGGKVQKNPVPEIGFHDGFGWPFEIELTFEGRSDSFLKDIPSRFAVFHLHGETAIFKSEAKLLGEGKHCRNQIVRVGKFAYGFQCHFELTEEMLQVWLKEDSDLKSLDFTVMMNEFLKIKKSYQERGRIITKNFLQIVRQKEELRDQPND